MVYNAMKLFMEVNPQLFDECSHNYAEKQTNAPSEEEKRQKKWERIARMAKSAEVRKGSGNSAPMHNGLLEKDSMERLLPVTAGHGAKMPPTSQMDGSLAPDLMSQDRLGRLRDLSIQEDSAPGMKGRAAAAGIRS